VMLSSSRAPWRASAVGPRDDGSAGACQQFNFRGNIDAAVSIYVIAHGSGSAPWAV